MNDVFERIKKLTAEQLGIEVDTIKEESDFIKDLGADSLDTVELLMAFEEEFSIEIPEEIAEKINTVKQAIEHIEEQQQQK